MSGNSYLVILSSLVEEKNKDKIIKTIEKYEGEFTQIFLIGREMRTIDETIFEEKADKIVNLVEDASRIFIHEPGVDEIEEVMISSSVNSAALEFLKYTKEKIVFVCFDNRIANNPYELSAFLKLQTLDNKFFLMDPKYIKTNFFQLEKAEEIYFPLFNEKPKLTKERKEQLHELILEGIDIIRFYIHAGFHMLMNEHSVPGWCVSANTTWISLMISLFDLKRNSNDLLFKQEMTYYAKMRSSIFKFSLIVISSYILNTLKLFKKEDMVELYRNSVKNSLYEEKIDEYVNDDEKLFEFFALKSGSIEDAKIWSNMSIWNVIREKFLLTQ